MTRTQDLVAVAVAGATLGLGCASPAPASTTVGPAGGEVTSADGLVTLSFPPKAVATPTAITIAPMASPPTGALADTAYDLGPDGLTFGAPVTLTLHPGGNDPLPTSGLHVVGLHDGVTELDGDPTIDPTARTIQAALVGFSPHWATPDAVACPQGCPVALLDFRAEVQGDGHIRLSAQVPAPAGAVRVERSAKSMIDGAVEDFTDWTTVATISLPPWPTGGIGNQPFAYDDWTTCTGSSYAYRLRAISGAVVGPSTTPLLRLGGYADCTKYTTGTMSATIDGATVQLDVMMLAFVYGGGTAFEVAGQDPTGRWSFRAFVSQVPQTGTTLNCPSEKVSLDVSDGGTLYLATFDVGGPCGINFLAFGAVGQPIIGSFSGQVATLDGKQTHSINGQFNVVRQADVP